MFVLNERSTINCAGFLNVKSTNFQMCYLVAKLARSVSQSKISIFLFASIYLQFKHGYMTSILINYKCYNSDSVPLIIIF